MANITDARVIKFCNRNARPLADLISELDRTLPQFLLNVVRDFENITGANASGDKIIDGATTADGVGEDGRTRITKAEITNLKTVVTALKATMDTSTYRTMVNTLVTKGTPIF